jgi:hypothetical protein
VKVTAHEIQHGGRKRRVFGVTIRIPLLESEWERLQDIALRRSLSLRELCRRTVLAVLLGVRRFGDPDEKDARRALRELAQVELVEERFECGGCLALRERLAAERAARAALESELARRDIEALRAAAVRAA